MRIFLDRDAAKFIQKLQRDEREGIIRRIKALEADPYLGKKLKGRKNTYSLRVGNFRIIYEIHSSIQEIWILKVDRRGRVYKGM